MPEQYPQTKQYVDERGSLTFRLDKFPHEIIIPVLGYSVRNTPNNIMFPFDEGMSLALKYFRDEFEWVTVNPYGTYKGQPRIQYVFSPTYVFNSREYAMGVAFGLGVNDITDLANNRVIKRRSK